MTSTLVDLLPFFGTGFWRAGQLTAQQEMAKLNDLFVPPKKKEHLQEKDDKDQSR